MKDVKVCLSHRILLLMTDSVRWGVIFTLTCLYVACTRTDLPLHKAPLHTLLSFASLIPHITIFSTFLLYQPLLSLHLSISSIFLHTSSGYFNFCNFPPNLHLIKDVRKTHNWVTLTPTYST